MMNFDPVDLMPTTETCGFFGGLKPIHPSTLWRGIKAGRYPPPIKIGPNANRWLRQECTVALAALIAQRDARAA